LKIYRYYLAVGTTCALPSGVLLFYNI